MTRERVVVCAFAFASTCVLAACTRTDTATGKREEPVINSNAVTFPLKGPRPAPPPVKGVALGLYCEDSGWSYGPLLEEVAQMGASHVSLVAGYYLKDIHDHVIQPHPRYTPTEKVLRRTIARARKLGLKVLLFPILRVLHKPAPGHWRGNLKPKNRAELCRSYTAWITGLARLAADTGVDSLCVGSELNSLDTDPAFFEPVVRQVRQVFKGPLIYAANWDHFRKVRIWPLVDQPGLSAYFGIAGRPRGASVAEMIEGWRDVMMELTRWSRIHKKPLVFTELGYMSQQGAARAPWDESAKRPLDLEEQRRAYEAFVRVWNGVSELSGTYVWNWYGWGGERDRHYTPRNKPAARIIAWWYGGQWPIKWWKPE